MFAVRLSTVTLAAVLIIAACAASPQDGLSQGPTQSASPQDGLSQGPTPSAAPSASPRLAFAGVIAAPGDGGTASAAALNQPWGLAFDAGGNLFIADPEDRRVRRVGTDGRITTVAGNGTGTVKEDDNGPAVEATLHLPRNLAIDRDGNLYISDTGPRPRIRKVTPGGVISTVVGGTGRGEFPNPGGIAFGPAGDLYIVQGYPVRIAVLRSDGRLETVAGDGTQGYRGDGGQALSARLHDPEALATDPSGALFVADYSNYRVRRIGTDGVIKTVAGNGMGSYGAESSDGVAATSVPISPQGLAVDPSGNLYLSDFTGRLRVVAPNGTITTVASGLSLPYGIAVDAAGDLFVADGGNHRVVKIAGGRTISVVAGATTLALPVLGNATPTPPVALQTPPVQADSCSPRFLGPNDSYVAQMSLETARWHELESLVHVRLVGKTIQDAGPVIAALDPCLQSGIITNPGGVQVLRVSSTLLYGPGILAYPQGADWRVHAFVLPIGSAGQEQFSWNDLWFTRDGDALTFAALVIPAAVCRSGCGGVGPTPLRFVRYRMGDTVTELWRSPLLSAARILAADVLFASQVDPAEGSSGPGGFLHQAFDGYAQWGLARLQTIWRGTSVPAATTRLYPSLLYVVDRFLAALQRGDSAAATAFATGADVVANYHGSSDDLEPGLISPLATAVEDAEAAYWDQLPAAARPAAPTVTRFTWPLARGRLLLVRQNDAWKVSAIDSTP
ncbi:MAG: hypothetical protein E6I87_13345 [Chloroflexi bacterium]|nr:MAG: hypothetical protein E6I87_13345 [Chloroflexota bacterium]